ncbi:uncharacterized protein LOC135957606 [Calliphora vicina]|uniref:uncharacterized protein LOC135957606 n=1 Tax=Calliphora vicina TaxID=7373 RepID=UPI00325BFAE8
MKKRHLQNCLSKEKKAFESEIKKYKSLVMSANGESVEKNLQNIREVLVSEAVPSTSAGFVGSEFVICELESDRSEAALGDSLKTEVSVLGSDTDEADQSVLPPTTYSFPKEPEKCQDILATLEKILKGQQAILEGQKVLRDRLKKVEENQSNILVNQGFLTNGQAVLVTNQENIERNLERYETNHKAESVAQNKVLMECKVSIRKVEQSVCHMTGETVDHNLNEVESMLPLKTLEEVDSIEEKLQSPDFAMAVKTFMFKTKGITEDVSEVMRSLMTDELLDKFNWEGRWSKKALGNLTLFNNLLRDVFSQQSSIEFERGLRKAVDKSHHRQKQKIYFKKIKEQKLI